MLLNNKIPRLGDFVYVLVTPATAGVGLSSESNANQKNYKIVMNVNFPAWYHPQKFFNFCGTRSRKDKIKDFV